MWKSLYFRHSNALYSVNAIYIFLGWILFNYFFPLVCFWAFENLGTKSWVCALNPDYSVMFRNWHNSLKRIYKCLHQAAPIYLSELCIPVASFTGRSHLRLAVKECLVISYCRTKNYGQRSFSYSGPTLWNSLPLTVRDNSMSLSQFCSRLKTEMFCRAYNWS